MLSVRANCLRTSRIGTARWGLWSLPTTQPCRNHTLYSNGLSARSLRYGSSEILANWIDNYRKTLTAIDEALEQVEGHLESIASGSPHGAFDHPELDRRWKDGVFQYAVFKKLFALDGRIRRVEEIQSGRRWLLDSNRGDQQLLKQGVSNHGSIWTEYWFRPLSEIRERLQIDRGFLYDLRHLARGWVMRLQLYGGEKSENEIEAAKTLAQKFSAVCQKRGVAIRPHEKPIWKDGKTVLVKIDPVVFRDLGDVHNDFLDQL
jgi:hypothetical protein